MSFANKPNLQFSSGSDNAGSSHEDVGQFFSSSQNDYFNNMDREVNPEFSEPNDYEYPQNTNSNRLNVHTGPHFFRRTHNELKQLTQDKFQRPTPYSRSGKSEWNNQQNKNLSRLPNHNINDTFIKEKMFSERSLDDNKFSQNKYSGVSLNEAINTNANFKATSTHTNLPNFTMSTSTNKTMNKVIDGSRTRHLTGSADHVMRWNRMIKSQDLFIIYEASGSLENMITQGCKQLLFLRGESGHILQVVFYTIDRKLPTFQPGAIIVATGHMVGGKKLQAFDVVEITKKNNNQLSVYGFMPTFFGGINKVLKIHFLK